MSLPAPVADRSDFEENGSDEEPAINPQETQLTADEKESSGNISQPGAADKPVTPKKSRVTKKEPKIPATKGNNSEPSSFGKFYGNDSGAAAYLTISDVGEFKKYRFSYLILEYALCLWQNCTGKSNEEPFRMIRDYIELGTADTQFPRTLQELVARYPIVGKDRPTKQEKRENSEARNHIYAGILYRCAEDIESTHEPSEQEVRERQKKASDAFQAARGLKIPEFDATNLKKPALGPWLELGEHSLEKYNRVDTLLRGVNHVMADSRWVDRFQDREAKQIFAEQPVAAVHIPQWMRALLQTETVAQESAAYANPDRPEDLPRRHFRLIYKGNAAMSQYFEELETERGLILMPRDTTDVRDPRVYPTGAEWRDTIRTKLNFEELRVDFLLLALESADKSEEVIVYSSAQDNAASWSDVKDLVSRHESLVFRYRLQPLSEGDEFQLEFDGVPVQLSTFMVADESNGIRLHPEIEAAVQVAEALEDGQPEQPAQDQSPADVAKKAFGEGISKDEPPDYSTPDLSKEFKLPEDATKMKDYYAGHDVSTKKGEREYLSWAIDQVCGTILPPKSQPAFKARQTKFSKEDRDVIMGARKETEAHMLSADAEQQNAEGLQLEYMKAFTDTGNVGPQVKLSQIALNMKTASKHPPQNILDTYRCESLNIDREFLPSQIVGATYMLQRTCGMVPNPASSDEVDVSTANDVRQNQLRSLRTFGGLIVDGTGMGKSDTALLFASWYSRYGDHTDEQGQPCHRPGVLLCPTGTVEQWFKLIAHHYKDLAPILCHGERPPKGESGNWVSATAMRQGPENMTHWPTKLKYVFQKDQPKASQAIFISSYDTFPGRSLAVDWRKSRKEKNDFEDRKPVYKPRYVGCFAYSILDEGHRVRHDDTEAYKSVKLTQCPVNWFLTATPVVNHPDDVKAIHQILGPSVLRNLLKSGGANEDWLTTAEKKGYKIADELEGLDPLDIRRTAMMLPQFVASLLSKASLTERAKYYHYINNLCAIHRTTASKLDYDGSSKISLESMIPGHSVATSTTKHKKEERPEFEFHHNLWARHWHQAILNVTPDKKAVAGEKPSKKHIPNVAMYSRRLAVNTTSVLLGRLELVVLRVNRTTLVNELDGYRSKKHDVDWFIGMVKKPGDPPTNTHLEKLKFLVWGSPKLRNVLVEIKKTILDPEGTNNPRPRKLLGICDIPLPAWFYELVLRFLGIDARVVHAGLNAEERQQLMNRFNKAQDSLAFLIIMYNVSGQGLNLDGACCKVLVLEVAINAALEIQGWGRVLRVTQNFSVTVVRLITEDSFDSYKEYRQRDKAIMELASRSNNPDMRSLLVRLLNEGNQEVQKARLTSLGQMFERGEYELPTEDANDSNLVEYDDYSNKLASIVQDPLDLQTTLKASAVKPTTEKRKSTKPERYAEVYLDDGALEQNGKGKGRGKDVKKPRKGEDDFVVSDEEEGESDKESSTSFQLEEVESDSDDSDDSDDSHATVQQVGYLDQSETEQRNLMITKDATRLHDTLDIGLEPFKKHFRQLGLIRGEDYDQEKMNVEYLLRFDGHKVYQEADLGDERFLDRALRLLYRARFGQEAENARISVHVKYSALPEKMRGGKGKMGMVPFTPSQAQFYKSLLDGETPVIAAPPVLQMDRSSLSTAGNGQTPLSSSKKPKEKRAANTEDHIVDDMAGDQTPTKKPRTPATGSSRGRAGRGRGGRRASGRGTDFL